MTKEQIIERITKEKTGTSYSNECILLAMDEFAAIQNKVLIDAINQMIKESNAGKSLPHIDSSVAKIGRDALASYAAPQNKKEIASEYIKDYMKYAEFRRLLGNRSEWTIDKVKSLNHFEITEALEGYRQMIFDLDNMFYAVTEGVEQWETECNILKRKIKKLEGQVTGKSAGVFVKESDGVPKNSNLVHINYSAGETDFKVTGFYEPSEKKWYRADGTPLVWYPNLEWLDESGEAGTADDLIDFAMWMYKQDPEWQQDFPTEEHIRKVAASRVGRYLKTGEAGKQPAPIWYTREGIFIWLRNECYSDGIATELSGLIAEHLQLAFEKGYQKGQEGKQPEQQEINPGFLEGLKKEPLNAIRTLVLMQLSEEEKAALLRWLTPEQQPAAVSPNSDALASHPNFDQLVSMIKKLFYDYQEDVLKASKDRIDKAWERYKTLNHLFLDAPGSAQTEVSGEQKCKGGDHELNKQ